MECVGLIGVGARLQGIMAGSSVVALIPLLYAIIELGDRGERVGRKNNCHYRG